MVGKTQFTPSCNRHRRTRPNPREDGAHGLLGKLAVVVGLEIEPHFSGPCEVAGEAQGGFGGDGAFALHDLIDATWGHADVLGKTVFRESQRQKKILAQNFTGMNGGVLFHGVRRSMIVHDFHIMRDAQRVASRKCGDRINPLAAASSGKLSRCLLVLSL